MEEILRRHGVSFRFLDAVDGSAPDAGFEKFWKADARRGLLNAGEIGCMLSHMAIWKRTVEDGIACSIVLEDDLCVGDGFGDLVATIGELPDLGLLKLETDRDPLVTDRSATYQAGAHQCQRLIGGAGRTGAYVIWRSAAETLLASADSFADSIDIEMFRPRQPRPQWPDVYQLVPAICIQAELVPDLVGDVPFLQSSIARYGERADSRLGLGRKREAKAVRAMRRALRPLKHGVMRAWHRSGGRRHQIVDFAGSEQG